MFVNGVHIEKRVNLATKTKAYRVFIQVGPKKEAHLLRKIFRANYPARQYGEAVVKRYERMVRDETES